MFCKSCYGSISKGDTIVSCQTCSKVLHKNCAINDDGTFCDVCYTEKEVESKEKPKIDFEMPKVIRRSYIETYRTCPYQFYMSVIMGNEMPPNIYTQLGIDLHELFDKASLDLTYRTHNMVNDFNKYFDSYNNDLFTEGTSREDMYKRGIDSIQTFYNVIKDMPIPFKTEETIQFSVGEGLPLVQATSDRVNIVDGELEMMDWKTGQVMVGKNHSSDLQAPLYIYSVREKYGIPVRKFTFYYLKDNKERVFHRVHGDDYVCTVGKREYKINLTDAIREVQHIFSQIKKGNFNIPIETKGMYFSCKMCHIKAKGLCEGAEMQVWNQFNK